MANQRMYLICKRCFNGDVYDSAGSYYLAKRMAMGYYHPGHDQDLGEWLNDHAACLDAFEVAYEMDRDYDYGPEIRNRKLIHAN